jgi:predicted O-methyltransferase YrrM
MENLMSDIKKPLKGTRIYQLTSSKYHQFVKLRDIIREARQLNSDAKNANSIDELISIQMSSKVFLSGQRKGEISQLLSLLASRKPLNVMEIGTRKGGTFFLLSRVCDENAKIISLDYKYPSLEIKKALKYFAKKKQKIIVIEGDSHNEATLLKIKSVLCEKYFDFLFIDGDHAYDGVKKDYEMYSKFVKVGGTIAFHDIVPDYSTKHGQKTAAYTGGVPVYWKELKAQGFETIEFVEQSDQDGYGIGVIIKK